MVTESRGTRTIPHIEGLSIQKRIGAGAHSEIWVALHDATRVACKIGRHTSPESHRHFFREASILARATNPGLIRAYEVGVVDQRPYLVTEYVDGQNLQHWLREHGRMDEAVATRIIGRLARALGELHRVGTIHRDIHPANILLDEQMHPKLIDLGLAARVDEGRRDDSVEGTFAYAPAEQSGLLDRPVDPRTDLYSLGVVSFECLTGRRPFESSNMGDLLQAHATQAAPRVTDVEPSCSQAISAIVDELLRKDPDDRFQSAGELTATLSDLVDGAADATSHQIDAGHTPPARRPPMAGRDDQLDQLCRLWETLETSSGRAAIVFGESGLGKSRIVEQAIDTALPGDLPVLSARCARATHVPFGALREAIDEFTHRVVGADGPAARQRIGHLRRACRGYRDFLGDLSPALGDLLGASARAHPVETPEAQADTAASFLLDLADACGGLIIWLDNLQWIDQASRRMLDVLGDRLADAPVLFLGACRQGASYSTAVDHWQSWTGRPRADAVWLEPLTRDEVGELVAGQLSGQFLGDSGLDQITLRAGGNPLAVQEYLHTMFDHGLLRPDWGQWAFVEGGATGVDLPDTLADLMVHRVDKLAGHQLDILNVAAVQGTRFDQPVLERAVDSSASSTRSALQAAASHRLIHRAPDATWTFVHERIPEALFEEMAPEHRRRLHGRIADAIGACIAGGQLDGDEAVFSRAHHLLESNVADSGDDDRITQARQIGLKAARRACKECSDELARAYLERLRPLGADQTPADAQLFYRILGTVEARRGHVEAAIEAYSRAIEYADTPDDRARLHNLTAGALMAETRSDRALEHINSALGELDGRPSPWFGVELVSSFGYLLAALVVGGTGLGFGSARSSRRYEAICQSLQYAVHVHIMRLEYGKFITALWRFAYFALRNGGHQERVNVYGLSAVGAGEIGLTGLYERLKQAAQRVAHGSGRRRIIGTGACYCAVADALHGADLTRAADHLDDVIDQYGLVANPDVVARCFSNRMWVAMMDGQFKQAVQIMDHPIMKNRRQQTHGAVDDVLGAVGHAGLGNVDRSDDILEFHNQRAEIMGLYTLLYIAGNRLLARYYARRLGGPTDEIYGAAEPRMPSAAILSAQLLQLPISYAAICFERLLCSEPDAPSRARAEEVFRTLEATKHDKVPLVDAHFQVIASKRHLCDDNPKRALKAIEAAQRRAEQSNNQWVLFEVFVQRARLAGRNHHPSMVSKYVAAAATLADDMGYVPWRNWLSDEFSTAMSAVQSSRNRPWEVPASPRAGAADPSTSSSSQSAANLVLQRRYDALIRMSQAAAEVVDLDELLNISIRTARDILTAERAAIFKVDSAGQMSLKVGIDADGQAHRQQLPDHSSTAVRQAYVQRQALVLSGNSAGEMLGSQSAVVHGLRSIMAAPISLQDQVFGVLYLDSRLAKGVFTTHDLDVLRAVATQIALSLETAKVAAVETQRKVLEKDLEIAAAVQTLFLPSSDVVSGPQWRLVGDSRSADQCGGDWWWYQPLDDGRLVVAVGDVTGHGAGAAMVTSTVAALFADSAPRAFRPDQLLPRLNDTQYRLFGGQHCLTLTVGLIDPANQTVDLWLSGPPPALMAEPDGELVGLLQASSRIGESPEGYQFAHLQQPCPTGSRLFIFTDGIPECPLEQSRPFGLRRTRRLLENTRNASLESARKEVWTTLDEFRRDGPLDDDQTFVFVNV